MNPEVKIRELIHKSDVTTSPQTEHRILGDALGCLHLRQKKTLSDYSEPNIWRTIMKSRTMRFATVAVIMGACVIGLSLWWTTGSGITLADVLARVEQVTAFSLKWSMKITIEDPNNPYRYEGRGTQLQSRDYGSKLSEEPDPNGDQNRFHYLLPQKNVRIIITPKQKNYLRIELNDIYVKQERERGGLQQQNDPLAHLKKMLKYKYESLGTSVIEGIDVAGFRSTDPNMWPQWKITPQNPQFDVKLWVDVETLLPVRYEYEHVRQTGDETKDHMHMVYSDFRWNISVDGAEFDPGPIPNDYTIQDAFPNVANEENTIGGLKQCGELLGKYPERIDLTYLWAESEKGETTAALQLREELRGLTGLDRDNKKMDALKPIRFLNKFYIELAKKDPAYYGNIVALKEADKVLMRWKVSNGEYRVIYGDLHAETVTQERLRELETAIH